MANEYNGRDPMAGLPWWVKAIVVIVGVVGVPSAISLGLVWSDRTELRTTVNANATVLGGLTIAAGVHDRSMNRQFETAAGLAAETNRILSATCVNAAKSDEQRDRCVGRR